MEPDKKKEYDDDIETEEGEDQDEQSDDSESYTGSEPIIDPKDPGVGSGPPEPPPEGGGN